MNTDNLEELIKVFGQARETVNVGDNVLCDGDCHEGEYVTFCKVISVNEGIVTLQEEHTYFFSGNEVATHRESSVSTEYFKKSIPVHLQESRDLMVRISTGTSVGAD
jgi:hypothetical protein